MSDQLEMWKPKGEVSLEEMDGYLKAMRNAKEDYEDKKAISTEAFNKYKELEAKVAAILEAAGKEKYVCEGVGTVSVKKVLSVKTPKTPEQKRSFFEWIRREMGEDAYYAYMTVNSQSLNKLYKDKAEEYGDKGEILDIEGLEAPTASNKVSFRRS